MTVEFANASHYYWTRDRISSGGWNQPVLGDTRTGGVSKAGTSHNLASYTASFECASITYSGTEFHTENGGSLIRCNCLQVQLHIELMDFAMLESLSLRSVLWWCTFSQCNSQFWKGFVIWKFNFSLACLMFWGRAMKSGLMVIWCTVLHACKKRT